MLFERPNHPRPTRSSAYSIRVARTKPGSERETFTFQKHANVIGHHTRDFLDSETASRFHEQCFEGFKPLDQIANGAIKACTERQNKGDDFLHALQQAIESGTLQPHAIGKLQIATTGTCHTDAAPAALCGYQTTRLIRNEICCFDNSGSNFLSVRIAMQSEYSPGIDRRAGCGPTMHQIIDTTSCAMMRYRLGSARGHAFHGLKLHAYIRLDAV
ncbi:MAG TPA: hypothetical protein P5114_06555 [Hyphomicrobiaceae bacterium]|nr:hypothetical protein [Hyphomicrobiaceae bacterium]